MNHPHRSSDTLPPNDLPPQQLGPEDHGLRRQLDAILTQQFQQHCDASHQTALAACDWSIQTIANCVTLVIICPDPTTNWYILNQVTSLSHVLAKLSKDAKLRIYATPGMREMVEVRVDERSVYQEPT